MSQSQNLTKPDSGEARILMTHDTPEFQAIAAVNTILQCQVGSRLHGVVVDNQDDSDEMGVVIEPPEYVIRPPEAFAGFKRFAQYEHRTAGRGVRSGPTDECLIAYSLRKWVGMAAYGDPTILLPLLVPDEFISRIAWPGHDLRARREWFITKQVGERYLGYLDTQLACLKGEHPRKTNRPELIAVHGYDTKYAFHALRLAYQGTEMMRRGELTLPICGPQHSLLTEIRHGRESLDRVLVYIENARDALILAYDNTFLTEQPDYTAIGEWLQQTYRAWWDDYPWRSGRDEPCM